MASGIAMIDAEDKPGYMKVAAWTTTDVEGMITVAYLGTFPTTTTQLGGHEQAPAALARLILREYK